MTTTAATADRASAGSLRAYLITRVLLVIPMVWVLVTLVFFVMRVIGDPIEAAFGGKVTPQDLANRRHQAGLDRPLLTQYWEYLKGVAHFDFGTTLTDHQRISTLVIQRGAATFELVVYAVIVAFVVGVPLGRFAARFRDRLPDVSIRLFAVLAYAMPVFFTGLLFKLLFAVKLGWLPTSRQASANVDVVISHASPNTHIYLLNAILHGTASDVWDVLKHAVLPALTLGLYAAGIFTRLIRVNLLQTLRADYVEAARARGIKERWVVQRHAFRNALIPVVTAIGLQIAGLLSGSVLTETTFEWQGLGYTIAQYLRSVDFIAVQGIVTAIAVIVALISLVIDVIVAIVDPRVRYSS